MIIHHENNSATTVSGTFSVNITCLNNILKQIYIKPASDSTTYNFTLTDIHDNVIVEYYGHTGTFNETNVDLPTYGNYTFTVSLASADEAFSYLFVFRET